MRNEHDEEMTQKELLQEACDELASVCDLLFELETEEGKAAGFIVDSALRYCSAILKEEDPRISEEFLFEMKMKNQKGETDDHHCNQSTFD